MRAGRASPAGPGSVAADSFRPGSRVRGTAIAALALLAAVAAGPAATAEAQAVVFPAKIPLPDDFRPEGIAIGPGEVFYAGSIPTGDIYGGSLRTGAGEIVVEAPEGRAAIGLAVDSRGRLFVAGGPTGDGYVYDPATGDTLAAYDFASAPTPTFINDVVVTQAGAWFTDSFQPVLYFVPIAPDGTLAAPADVEALTLTGDFAFLPGEFNLNGIDATPDGGALVVVQSATGKLFRVDPASGETHEIELAGESVPAGDGILLDGMTLYVVQNRLNQVARIDLAPDLGSGTVVSRTTDAGFDVPTTAAEFGNRLYLVNARFGTTPTPSTEYWITQIPKP